MTSPYASYLIAADNHNIGNDKTSWFEPETLTQIPGNIAKFAATSILSGANSFYNTAAAVGSFIGLEAEQNPTDLWISSIDSDLGQYYRDNQAGVDLGGFVLGSLIPGIGAVKALNAGQVALRAAKGTGYLGGNLGTATKLLAPDVQKYVNLAAAEINSSTTTLKLLNAQTSKALGAGLWQNTLEAAAFETMVQITMAKSPILEAQDLSDIVLNIGIGGVLGGVIGGAVNAAKIRGSLKAAVKAEDAVRYDFIARDGAKLSDITSPSERIVTLAFDSEYAIRPAFPLANFDAKQTLYQNKITKNLLDIRSATNDLAKGDTEMGNSVANLNSPIKSADGEYSAGFAQTYHQNYSGVVRIARAGEKTKEELAFEAAKLAGEIPEQNIAVRWVSLHGDSVGQVIPEAPKFLYLADIHKGKDEVLSYVRDQGFSSKFDASTPLWSATRIKGANKTLQAEARYIWATHVLKEIPKGALIDSLDIPVLSRALADRNLDIKIVSGEGPSLTVKTPASVQELYETVKQAKHQVAADLLETKIKSKDPTVDTPQTVEEIARIVDVKPSYLENLPGTSEVDDLFATQAMQGKYTKDLQARAVNSSSAAETQVPIEFLPKTAKFVYDVDRDFSAVNENVLNAITLYKEQQKLYQEGAERVFAKNVGPSSAAYPSISDEILRTANRIDGGAGLVTSQGANYGTIGSVMGYIGSLTRELRTKFRTEVSDSIESSIVKLGQTPEAAIEFESINQKITRSGQLWVRYSENGEEFFVTQRALKQFGGQEDVLSILDDISVKGDTVLDFDSLNSQLPEDLIQIFKPETVAFVDQHIQLSGKRTQTFREIHAQQGKTDVKHPDVFRPIRPDLRRYTHFAFVVDPRVTGSGHMTMIHAASEKELAQLIDRVPQKYKTLTEKSFGSTVLTKQDIEDFKRARHEYDYDRSLNENYINSELANEGVFSNFFPKSDPGKIVDDILQQHYREADTLAIELTRLRYEPQFNLLEDMGQAYSKVDTSQFGSRIETLEKRVDNPYFNLIKTALDISKVNENDLIFSANKLLDEAVSKAWSSIQATFSRVNSPQELEQINTQLDKYGMKPAYYDAALQALANHTAPKGVLTSFVRQANSLLSLFTLGLDPLNALNNAIGSNILRMTELKHLVRAIQAGNTDVAGELAAISRIQVPGVDASMLAPTKLHAKAIQNFWEDKGEIKGIISGAAGPLMSKYKEMGLIKGRVEQLKLLVDDFTLKGTETVAELNSRMREGFARSKDLLGKAESATGNPLVEEFNRFISANVMDQITSIAVKHGLMTPAEAKAYIYTFVSRVEGNTVASQRPLIFQGPIGQAVGLFQSYQFNLLQQLFRYVGEGSKKDLAMLGGLQSTLYGLQSLPAFQFANVHIIGKLSGNTEHKDAYDATYGTVGKTAGDFFLYGLPSNILQTNIYSRGDINPRHLTILPTSLQDIPIVQGWGKLLGSMYDTFSRIKGGGAVWESILQGVEHNGISRPLAGFAQTLQALGPNGQVYSTSSKGTILYSNDLLSLASVSRLAGGRPLDEAIVNDAMFRVKSYEAARRSSMLGLSERIKTTLIQGNEPDEEQILAFAQRYAELGGKQAGFNKWMMDLYKSANTPQAEKIATSLGNPFAYKMQLSMGGED
jgi:hypothetical protein